MEKEKQIENIENIVDVILPIMKDGEFSARNLARALNKSGYGNVKEALKEFAERVKGIFSGNAEERQKGYAKEIVCSLTVDEFNEEIDELIKEVCGG